MMTVGSTGSPEYSVKLRSIHTLVPLLLLSLMFGCNEHITDNPAGMQQPRTYLWLFPDSTVGVGVSRQHLHWWGDDPDGVVKGFLFSFKIVDKNITTLPVPDTLRYIYTQKNDSTVSFPLDTLFERFLVVVRSVDNSFSGLSEGDVVRMLPFPFLDRNDNGIYDAGDVQLPLLTSALDPKGAVQTFPVRNTPPSVSFVQNPNDPSAQLKQPDTTYTCATFVFSATDPDGQNTLRSYRIALNDTSDPSNWLTIPMRDSMVTLVVPRQRSDAAGAAVVADVYAGTFLGRQLIGQIPGLKLDALNVFFVQARDVAGEYSQAAVMPSGSGRWFVKRPRGRLLLVSDYVNSDASTALGTYLASLAAVPGGEFQVVDRLNIGLGVTLDDKNNGKTGTLVPAFADPALIQTFLLYDYVFWYTDQFPSLGVAQVTLFPYLQNGGKVLFSTSFLNTIDPRGALRDFAPIDSVSSVTLPAPALPSVGDTRIPANTVVYPDSSNPGDIFPLLAFDASRVNHSIFMRPIYRRSDARYIYHLQPDSMRVIYHPGLPDSVVLRNRRNNYLGAPNIGVVDGERHIVFIGLPLHLLNNVGLAETNVSAVSGQPAGLPALFEHIVGQFSPSQNVNRAIF
jgi:hypothetical protein